MCTRLLAVLTTALLLVGVAGGSASAQEADLHDARGDMWRSDFSGYTEPAPRTRTGDVRRALVTHGHSKVVIRQRFVDLRRIGDYSLFTARIQTGAKLYRELQVEASRHGWRGTAKVFNRRGDRVACDAGHQIDYARNVVVMSVPRSCLNNPNRVRATAGNYWAHRQRGVFLMDNPHDERATSNAWTRWIRTG
jgi:hypothetical protein